MRPVSCSRKVLDARSAADVVTEEGARLLWCEREKWLQVKGGPSASDSSRRSLELVCIRRQSPFPFLLSAVRAMRVVAGALPAVVDREAL